MQVSGLHARTAQVNVHGVREECVQAREVGEAFEVEGEWGGIAYTSVNNKDTLHTKH